MVCQRPFVVTPYTLCEGDEELRPTIPDECPVSATGGSREPCRIHVHQRRKRKTGPGYPLFVVCCDVHSCTFTLYPPGFAPYQRQGVLQLSPCGKRVFGEGEAAQTDFRTTMFEAAVDPQNQGRREVRRDRRSARVVGFSRHLDDRQRSQIASSLSVPTGPLHYWLTESSRGTRTAVREVLAQLTGTRKYRASKLLVAGHLAGCWGEPLFYDVDREDIIRSPFCRSQRPERPHLQTPDFRSTAPTKVIPRRAWRDRRAAPESG
jgi:hypothetical protein